MPSVDGVVHRYVEARGMRFHVAEAGQGEPLLLLHGFPQHWYAWRHLIPLLADRYRLVMPDLRGFGWSDAPFRGYGTGDRVADILALMDALDLDRVNLVAHEWAAWAGFMACIREPARFRHHLAINMVHPWPDQRAMRRSAWRMWFTALWEYPLLGAAVLRHCPGFTRYILRRGASWDQADLDEFADSVRPWPRAHAGQALHWQYVLRDIPKLATGRFRKEHLTVPTTLLFAADDFAYSPEVLPGAAAYADDLDIRVVPGGHYLPEDHPELVADVVSEVFATLPSERSRPHDQTPHHPRST